MSTIQLKRGTTASWEDQNPVLEDGQPGLEQTSDGYTRLKVGNGSSKWSGLRYIGYNQYLPLDYLDSFPSITMGVSATISFQPAAGTSDIAPAIDCSGKKII